MSVTWIGWKIAFNPGSAVQTWGILDKFLNPSGLPSLAL